MSATTFKIVLQGLLALVPNNEPGGTNKMTVLMLDGNHSHGVECMSVEKYKEEYKQEYENKYKHKPSLLIRADNLECEEAGCESNQALCTCEEAALKRKEIWLEIHPQPQPPLQQLPKDPQRAIPRNRQEAAQLGYVANMARPPFNLSLNKQYLSASPPPNLLARLQFPFETITPCALARRSDGGEAFVHALGLRELGAKWKDGEPSQAMAQRVVASVTIPDPGTGNPKVILHLKDLDTQGEDTITLQSGAQGYLILFSNTTDELPVDDPCDDGVARHFALYYHLAQSPPPEKNQLIPHVRLTQSKCAEALTLQECEIPTFNPLDRPICPLVIYNPPD